ncbi:uncharacterized protein LOC125514323 isoform X2 [Triticum urartu]|uniref:Uncharacterized protein n=2 Tax=Triticum TaxID=4564 RepID=A0A9R0Y4L8_TRITD|nr:uncharacterized protein LOC119317621 isoform X2 [Triticum dicoccoides]XP_048535594.1 uncharacterized protein LOC125514323 isoform X2 [Triticum urartu]VAI48620.1 unnamed protein product [Triticum turgidum subsp. durum]
MERFDEYDCASAHSHQHPDRVSDSLEDPISDEDVQPTRLSLACATTKKREDDNRMAGHNESAIWDEVQEEADELAHVHKDPHAHSVSLLSAGTSKRSKCENKLKFSIRGFNSILSGVKSENSYAGEQEVLSGMRPAKAIETMMAEQFENIDEETETEELPPDFAHPTKNANISVAELLEDLQDRSASSVRTPFSIHQQTEAKEGKPKVSTSGKKILALLGQRDLDSEEHSEHAIGETSSEDEAEDTVRNNLTMVNKDVKGNRKTMSDLFQEAFTATDMEGTALPMRSTGAGYYGRMQQIMQMEKDRHAEFSRQYNRARDYLGDSKGVTVQILSRSLEGKLTVCLCLLKEKTSVDRLRHG